MATVRQLTRVLGRISWFGCPLGLLASHAKWQREPDAVACHGVTAIEVGKHESGARQRTARSCRGSCTQRTVETMGPGVR